MGFLCVECYKEFSSEDEPPRRYVLSKENHRCQLCGENKRAVLYERHRFHEWLIYIFYYRRKALWRKLKKAIRR